MKAFFVLFFLSLGLLVAAPSKAQIARFPAITKVSQATATVGGATVAYTIFEDTLASRAARTLNLRRGDYYVYHNGTTNGATVSIWLKNGELLYSGAVSVFRVVGASTQSDANKITYLKANSF